MPKRRCTSEYHVVSSDASDDILPFCGRCVTDSEASDDVSMKFKMAR